MNIAKHRAHHGKVDLTGIAVAHATFAAVNAGKAVNEPLYRRRAGVEGDMAFLCIEADDIVLACRAIAGHAPLHPFLPAY